MRPIFHVGYNTFKINAPIGNSHRIDYGRKHYNYTSNIEDILENFDFHTFQERMKRNDLDYHILFSYLTFE